MGWDIAELYDKKNKAVSIEDLILEAQEALLLYNVLPDIYAGMDGVWVGKNLSGLYDIMEIYDMENRIAIFELLQVVIQEIGDYKAKNSKIPNTETTGS